MENNAVPKHVIEASEKLEAAIAEYRHAMHEDGENYGVLVDWVFVISESAVNERGEIVSVTYFDRLGQPHYRTKGLLHGVLDYMQSTQTAHVVRDH